MEWANDHKSTFKSVEPYVSERYSKLEQVSSQSS